MIDVFTINWQKNSDSLIPVIIQDADTAQVLMLGYMNSKALEITLRTKIVTFYSRSKKRLWQKGETSGNKLNLVNIKLDCDCDALLVQVRPQGSTCHTGDRSCFSNDELALETIGLLIRTISRKAIDGDNNSYTKNLLDGGQRAYGAKVLEEAQEIVSATNGEGKQRTTEEVADLIYHLFVLLKGEGIEMEEVSEELRKRRK
ncbi:MAG: bifunctional phosphoribosyl-AMP cyclohydrolase/phosphoribosyl-ATP diphosphatase HisIE [Candidatus Peribacteraceae bacterium]|jgi:phosphoribosyl-ATP pyrophosphohydrolase/phosphoribosyl-AMP cyclohydrolase|nr:bifunctional phosphoribosyl-AMP cyclohydrolase/phosphoribosyl-ATP diphosphatase HisIE [Candidatus Peribacteraceae bacterium]|tara:strand:+ start:162 stop:767 length:606 start_codon:yes stop_codon:yes gene_type:complete